jgi:P-type Ca2+ transporter type 2C
MEYVIEALADFTLRILLVAAVLSLVIGISTEGWGHGWYEGTAILIAIVVIVAITVFNGYKQDQQFVNLYKKSDKKILKVTRNSKPIEIDS